MGKAETDEEIRKAFNVWSEVTPLTFTHKKSGQVRSKYSVTNNNMIN